MLFKRKTKQKDKNETTIEQTICDNSIEKIAIIDIETNWNDAIMSIGVVVASAIDFSIVDKKYYIITPEYIRGGMYSYVLELKSNRKNIFKKSQALNNIIGLLRDYNVEKIFAYNATFDLRHLPELNKFYWYDIMKVAANKNFNTEISEDLECFKNGKMKRGYGVEPMCRMLSKDCSYSETHNALKDAEDELFILAMLELPLSIYEEYACINDPYNDTDSK